MMRIDKLLVNLKYGSRKEIQKAIRQGFLLVNDETIKKGDYKVDPNKDRIIFLSEEVYYRDKVLLMMNKPKGYISANKDGLHKTVLELIKEPYDRFDLNIAGRLDIDTEGLILLTNDGTLLHNIISPKKNVYKKYLVTTKEKFRPKKLLGDYQIKDGGENLYKPLEPKVEEIDDTSFYLSIKEGKFHQVKRMVAHFSNEVVNLKRVQIGSIVLDETLKPGEYKEIEAKI